MRVNAALSRTVQSGDLRVLTGHGLPATPEIYDELRRYPAPPAGRQREEHDQACPPPHPTSIRCPAGVVPVC
jgi:hypothetical protein